MRRPKTAAVLVITGLVAIAAVYLLARKGDKDGNGTGISTLTGPGFSGPLDAELRGLWEAIETARRNKPKPGPGVTIDGSWLKGVVEYEKAHSGVTRRFVLHERVGIDAKITALEGYLRFVHPDRARAGAMLDMAEEIIEYRTMDSRFDLVREKAIGMVSFCARLKKANPDAWMRSFNILSARFDIERDAKMFSAVTSALTRYSKADILVPKLIGRFDALDLSNEYNVLKACAIVRAVAVMGSRQANDFILKTAREHFHPIIRATAVKTFMGKTAEWAVPVLEELLKTETDPTVINEINKVFQSKRKGFPR